MCLQGAGGETGACGGRLDFDLRSEVSDRRLHAPGRPILAEVSGKRDARDPRVEGARIRVDFTIEGAIASAEFSLDDALSTRLSCSLADPLGVGTIGLKGGDVFRGVFEDRPEVQATDPRSADSLRAIVQISAASFAAWLWIPAARRSRIGAEGRLDRP